MPSPTIAAVHLPDLSAIDGLVARPFTDTPDDWSAVSDLWTTSSRADGWEVVRPPEEFRQSWLNADDFDPTEDVVLVFRAEQPVAMATNRWVDIAGRGRAHRHMCSVLPEWRNRGIGHALLHWGRSELQGKAAVHHPDNPYFMTMCSSKAVGEQSLLEAHGYHPTEHFAEMVRTDLEAIPELDVPGGLEVRKVEETHLRAIYEAETEAFRDHWGFSEPTEKGWTRFLNAPHQDPSMWKVAWSGDRVIGIIRNFINASENEEYGRLRGWTEDISTHRDWRGRGVAAALIALSLRELKDRGMTEAALRVHTDNPNGAFGLYEKMGFRLTHLDAVWEAPLAPRAGTQG